MGDDVLAAVRLRSGKVNWREVGRLEQADRTGRPLLKSKRLALDHLHEHGPLHVARAAQAEHERQTAWTRALGYRVETSRTQNGVHTTTVTGGELAAGPEALRKARTVLSAILETAVEAGLIPTNPVRSVRAPKAPLRAEVRPLAPGAVEALRAVLGHRDAVLVSLLAYAGLRPGETRELRWGHVGERTLIVNASKTGRRRTVRLLDPLRADLLAWRMASGRPADDAPVIPRPSDGAVMSARSFNDWRGATFAPALQAAGLPSARPYDLRHSFASLLLHEGRSVIYVARELGHGANLTLSTYGHVIDELDGEPHVTAEDAIRAARASDVREAFAK